MTRRLHAAATGLGLSDNEFEHTLASARKGGYDSPRTAPVVKVVDHVDRAAQRPQMHLPTERPWPNPPGEDAFHGLAGDTVRSMEAHTEADAAATLAALLATFGNVVGPGPHHVIGETKHAAKLWPILIGRTAKGRKGEAQAQVDAVLGPLDPEWRDQRHASGLASGEGLIYHVRDEVLNFVRTGSRASWSRQ